MLLKERQYVLSVAVGGRQDGGAGLVQDLGPGEQCGLGSEVRVTDLRFTGSDVLEADLEGSDVGLDGVPFEGTESTTHLREFEDGGVENLAGQGRASLRKLVVLAGLERVEEVACAIFVERATQSTGRDRADSDGDLL